MKFKVEIDLDNDVFNPANGYELNKILTALAHDVYKYHHLVEGESGKLIDRNGNAVGDFWVEGDSVYDDTWDSQPKREKKRK